MTPADELRAAARKLRETLAALPTEDWGDRPWHVEECSDTECASACPCIVAQGEYQPFDQPQTPPIQYVADAETPECAAYIALMGPHVGRALVRVLDQAADALTGVDVDADEPALTVARAINGAATDSAA
ncbi:hypothetical protein [Streptomyces cinereoruber]|uniref:hypothetical protein n=1 Tax=Streptomyces cinereoruber TaxID=67260 RepID=UPI0036258AB8